MHFNLLPLLFPLLAASSAYAEEPKVHPNMQNFDELMSLPKLQVSFDGQIPAITYFLTTKDNKVRLQKGLGSSQRIGILNACNRIEKVMSVRIFNDPLYVEIPDVGKQGKPVGCKVYKDPFCKEPMSNVNSLTPARLSNIDGRAKSFWCEIVK